MDKVELNNDRLIDCKNKIMKGQSISSLARKLGVDRKTLKKKILEILSDEEMEKFEKKLHTNFRRNRKSIKNIKRENGEENYKKAVQTLVSLGITNEDIETIFQSINKNPHTTMAKDTFAIKLVEIFQFIQKRNEGIEAEDKGYITKEDVIHMILRDPRFMTNDVERKLEPMCDIFDNWSNNINKNQANVYIKRFPEVFKNSIKKVKIHLIIGDNFLVKSGNQYISLSEHILTENPFLISENSQNFLESVCRLRDSHSSGVIDAEELKKRMEPIKMLEEKYLLPEYEDDESFKRAVKDVIKGIEREDRSKKGEEK